MVVLPLPAAECRAAVPLVVLAFCFLVRRFSYLWYPKDFRIFRIYRFAYLDLGSKRFLYLLDEKRVHFLGTLHSHFACTATCTCLPTSYFSIWHLQCRPPPCWEKPSRLSIHRGLQPPGVAFVDPGLQLLRTPGMGAYTKVTYRNLALLVLDAPLLHQIIQTTRHCSFRHPEISWGATAVGFLNFYSNMARRICIKIGQFAHLPRLSQQIRLMLSAVIGVVRATVAIWSK